MGQKFKVAAIQMACPIGDVRGNVGKACSLIEQAAQEGALFVCLSEMFNTGYFSHTGHVEPSFLDLAEPLHESWTLSRMCSLAKKYHIYIVAPFVEKVQRGVFHNSAALIDLNGTIAGCYRKVHVPWSLTAWEKFYFRPGYEFPVFETKLGKVGIQICYDRDFPEGFRTLAVKGAELIVLPAGYPRSLVELWQMVCRVRAYENGLFLLGVANTGKLDSEHFELGGNSLLVGPTGEVISSLGCEEGILVGEVNLERIDDARRKRFALRDRRPETYGLVSALR